MVNVYKQRAFATVFVTLLQIRAPLEASAKTISGTALAFQAQREERPK
jgi:hypothetical protein